MAHALRTPLICVETWIVGLTLSDLGQVTSPLLGYNVSTVYQVLIASKAWLQTQVTGSRHCALSAALFLIPKLVGVA